VEKGIEDLGKRKKLDDLNRKCETRNRKSGKIKLTFDCRSWWIHDFDLLLIF
jgi:hypothetical protein